MEFIKTGIDVALHLDVYLNSWAGVLGVWLYVILFLTVFCETGLVVTPFLPGDSLLFTVGALAAGTNSPINIFLVWILLLIAAILGDAVNYSLGKWAGPKIFKKETSRWLNHGYLMKAHNFYEKYGGKTIVISRFLPIFRTFAPFVAGIGTMRYFTFAVFNVTGAFLWVTTFLYLGFKFSGLEIVKNKFPLVILAIIFISLLPVFFEIIRSKLAKKSV